MSTRPRDPEGGVPLRVLILEDNPDDAELVLRELRRGGFDLVWERVQTAEDFGAALQREWDVILSDFSMPSFNAFAALEILEGRRDAPPLIVVSGTIGEDTAVAAIKAGAQDYIMKDRPARLSEAVRRELRRTAVRRIHETDHRRAQEAIQKLLSAIEQTADVIVMTDPEARINYVNPSFEKLYGYSKEEAIGQTPRILKSDRHGADFYREFWRLLTSGAGFRGEVINRSKDGGIVPVEMSANAIFDDSGKRIGFIAVHHDVSERNRAEQEMRASQEQLRALSAHLQDVREDERTGIARELHDELGQALTALKMDLASIQSRLLSEEAGARDAAARKISAALEVADGMIHTIRRISSELRPGMLDDLGLLAAMEWLAQDFSERAGIPCRFRTEIAGAPPLDRPRSTAMFRIFQETLTNVARHSGATEVEAFLRKSGGSLQLEVHDNGKGFPPPVLQNSSSLGIIGMRERASSAGGNVEFESEPGQGTTMRLTVPLSRAESRPEPREP